MRLACLLAALLTIAALSPAAAGQPDPGLSPLCSDVLTIPRRNLLLGWKLRNSRVMLDGPRICTSDHPYPGDGRCDWEYDVRDIADLRPEDGTVLRVVSTVRFT